MLSNRNPTLLIPGPGNFSPREFEDRDDVAAMIGHGAFDMPDHAYEAALAFARTVLDTIEG